MDGRARDQAVAVVCRAYRGAILTGPEYLALLHQLPCVVCLNCYGRRVRADEAHHLEFVRGGHSDFASIPLCKACHNGLHRDRRRAFYLAHKLSDVKLLAWTIKLVAEYLSRK
jgi:hypothetical protein